MRKIEEKIQDRMESTVVKSYFKPWYKRVWGKALIVFALLIIASIVYFSVITVSNITHLQRGDIFNDDLGIWVSADQFSQNQQEIIELITEDDPWLGSEDPLIFVIAYESFGCPFCKADQPGIREMLAKFSPIVRFIAKDFPTEGLHLDVFNAHLASGCAQEQGRYWEYREALFDNQGDFKRSNLVTLANGLGLNVQNFEACYDSEKYNQEIRADYASGVQAGVIGTPSYVINGNLIPGSISADLWAEIIAFILEGDY